MRVIGPEWESVEKLREALANVQGPDFHWGTHAVQGVRQLQRLKAAGVQVPDFTTSLVEAQLWTRGGQQIWRRKNNHTQGRDIITNPRHRLWSQGDYWVEKIPAVAEFRQHIFNDMAIRRGKKMKVEEGRWNEAIHSRRNGWHIDYSAQDAPVGMREIAKKAVKALGYLYGAVDLVQTADGKLWVLEVNSAPSLKDENTLRAYVKAISGWATRRG